MNREFILLGMVVFAAIGYKLGIEDIESISFLAFIILGAIVGGYIGWRYERWLQS
jgi:hypothetical protein